RPETASEALFSIPACVAQILAEGDLTLADSAAGFWRTPRIRGLAERIAVTAVPARRPERNYDPEQPDRLVLEAGGARHEALCAYPLGAPQNPMSAGQLATKFTALTGRGAEAYRRLTDWAGTADIAEHVREAIS
ncbi:MAG: hypothetical protein AAFV49_22455, partial [Pseudomonadota bacterium]